MHKKRLRKKIGKQAKKKAIGLAQAFASMQVAMNTNIGIMNLNNIRSTSFGASPGVSKLSNALHAAECVIITTEANCKIWKKVEEVRSHGVDYFYRKKFGYPMLEVSHE